MGEWREYSIVDLAKIHNQTRIPLSSRERADRQGSFPYYGASGIIDYVDDYLFDGEFVLISEDGENLKSRQTPIAFKASGRFWVNNHAHIVRGRKPHHNSLITYFFQNLDLNPYITGAVQPKLSKGNLLSIPFLLPTDEAEQQAIATVLSSLDDKIDLLHRQNKTLEAMAETLFRQWFVEEAQDDWEEVPLDVVAAFLNGLACQKYPPQNEVDKLPVLKIKELKGGVSENSDWATSDVREEYIVRSGDIIFSWSGSLVVKIWNGSDCVLNQHLFKVTSQRYSKWFIYLWTRYHLQEFIAIAESKATTMGHIKRKDLSNSMALVPCTQTLDTMDRIMEPLIEKLILNNAQIGKLEELRDTLLPNLMSGEVRVGLGN